MTASTFEMGCENCGTVGVFSAVPVVNHPTEGLKAYECPACGTLHDKGIADMLHGEKDNERE